MPGNYGNARPASHVHSLKMSKFGCLSFVSVLCLSCSTPIPTAPSWQGTYVGGSLVDDCDAVTTDDAGNIYLGCHVVSVDLPGVSGAVQDPEDPMNAYVVKLTAELGAFEWGILLAGSKYDGVFDIAVDARGHVFAVGLTGSADFPVTDNALQKTYGGGEADAFLVEIDAKGKLLEVSFLGGSDTDQSFALDVRDGTLWLGGATSSPDFPGVRDRGVQAPSDLNAFVTRLSPEGTANIRSTIIGGSGYEKVTGISTTENGDLFLVGLTESVDLRLVQPLKDVMGGSGDGFVARLSAAKLEVLWSTFIGGAGMDAVWGVGVLSNGQPVIAGETTSEDLPTTYDAFQRGLAGQRDAFVARLDPAGRSIDYCSYYGGSGEDSAAYDGRSVVVDSQNRVWLTGQTTSDDLPTHGALQERRGGEADGFVARIRLGQPLEFATYLGGESRDIAEGVAIGPAGTVWISGLTASRQLPFGTTLQPSHAGGKFDCFLVGLQVP